MTEPQPTLHNARDRVTAARTEARRAAFRLARDCGAQIITRPMFRDAAAPTTRDAEPLAGARAARDLELGARGAARDYIRQAREAGHDWQQIGRALGLAADADADQAGATVADAAYTYAAGSPYADTTVRYGRSFAWTCGSCDQPISDQGLLAGPAEDEKGHAEGCSRLTAAVTEWDAGWEAEP